jgi:hypothetical protein
LAHKVKIKAMSKTSFIVIECLTPFKGHLLLPNGDKVLVAFEVSTGETQKEVINPDVLSSTIIAMLNEGAKAIDQKCNEEAGIKRTLLSALDDCSSSI